MHLHHVRAGSGDPLLLLHGHGDTHRLWRPVMGLLAREHECIAVDLPGFGLSRALSGAQTIERLTRAVREFMGGERMHVAGNSMGGAIALELAAGGDARSCCALAPIGFAEGWERAWLDRSQRLARAVLPRVPAALLRPAPVRRLLLAEYVARGERLPHPAVVDAARELGLSTGFLPLAPAVAGYTFRGEPACPTTVAWGEKDRLLLFGPQSRRACERLPRARHVTLRRCGHLPTWDDPEQVAEAILTTTGGRLGVGLRGA